MPSDGSYVRDKENKNLVKFFVHPRFEIDYIQIASKADPLTIIEEPVEERHKLKYRQKWLVYKGQRVEFEGQTRMENTRWMDMGYVGKLNEAEIFTVDQLAGLDDGRLEALQEALDTDSLRDLRERARRHQREEEEAAAAEVKAAAPLAENKRLKAQLEQANVQIQRLMKRQGVKAQPQEQAAV